MASRVWVQIPSEAKGEGTVAHWLHYSAFDFHWPVLTMRYIGKNRRFIAQISYISRDIADFSGFIPKYHRTDISPWNIVSKPSDTRYIADISRYFPPWGRLGGGIEVSRERRWVLCVRGKMRKKNKKQKTKKEVGVLFFLQLWTWKEKREEKNNTKKKNFEQILRFTTMF